MARYAILRLTLDTVSWTPVSSTLFDCTACSIENGDAANAIKVRTAEGDSSTERTIPANGGQLVIDATTGSLAPAFPKGEVICYLQAASGTGPAIVDFTR